MSYAIYIGRDLTADGIAYIAGYGDEPSSHWLGIYPRTTHHPGTTITVGVGPDAAMPGRRTDIPQARITARNMRVDYSYYLGVPAPITNGGLNEYGVAVRDVWSPSCQGLIERTPKDQTGPNYSDLARIVLERARTAREGVDLIAALIAEHGYSTYGGNSHMIADAEEAWVVIELAGGLGLWVAERLGRGDIRASRPGYIGEIPDAPDERILFPRHFIRTAVELGWYDPASGPFDVNAVYGDGKGRWAGVAWIEEEMRHRAARPEKIGLIDVFWSISTESLTGDTAGYGQVVPLVDPGHPDLRMLWHAPVGPVTAPLIPVFLGQSEVHEGYRQHRYLTTGESARFLDERKKEKNPDTVSRVPQGVETAESAVYQFNRLMHLAFQDDAMLAEVSGHWRSVEARICAELQDVLDSARILAERGERRLAKYLLSRMSNLWLDEALRDCTALAASGFLRLKQVGHLNTSLSPRSPPQLW